MTLASSSPAARPPGANRPFDIRGINVCESLSRHTPAQVDRLLERLVQWQMNTLVVHPHYGFDLHAGRIRTFCADHHISLIHYLYTVLDFTPHAPRELLAVDPDGSPYLDRVECETRLCSSNPAARRHFREGARRYFSEEVSPGDEVLLATPDGFFFCQCPRCRRLDPIAQWQPFLEIAVEEIERCGKPLVTHYIAYCGRMRPPEDMSVFEKIDAVMFDTHLRHRWLPLGASNPVGQVEAFEGRFDPEAARHPINVYLLDKLREWRQAFHGRIYAFENLMIQAAFSLPQPNTPALLEDIATYRTLGIDGVIYEAFEPGITAYASQLATLSASLAGQQFPYAPSPLESFCREIASPGDSRTRLLSYLYELECEMHGPFDQCIGSPVLRELGLLIRKYVPHPTLALWRTIARHALQHRDSLDWIYITYRLATYLPERERPGIRTPLQARLFTTAKPWDFLKEMENPQEAMLELVESLLDAEPDASRLPA